MVSKKSDFIKQKIYLHGYVGFNIVRACVNLIWQTEITQDPTNVYKPNTVYGSATQLANCWSLAHVIFITMLAFNHQPVLH